MTPDTQIDIDIAAFVNGQLDAERRFAVAGYLARHPARAAEVMAELQLTEGLRLALASPDSPPPAGIEQAAKRLERGLGPRRQGWWPAASAAAVAASFFLGYLAHDPAGGPAPGAGASDVTSLFEAALDAQDAVILRQSLSSTLGTMPDDATEISRRLGLALPDLPADWTLRAAHIVATPERPGLALVIDTTDLGQIMLFSVLRNVDGPDNLVDVVSRKGHSLAFFERDRAAYVLVDKSGPIADLRLEAEALSHRFN